MERTVPSRGNDEIALYLRTYYSLLRSTREVEIETLVEAHTRINSALHVLADERHPDLAAFIYVILRLPSCIAQARLVVMGQSEQVFAEHGYDNVESWQAVSSPGRRRRNYFDGTDTIAVYIASRSDIDDLMPSLTAYQIERRKLYEILNKPRTKDFLTKSQDQPLDDQSLALLAEKTNIPFDDLDRLRRIWGEDLAVNLLTNCSTRNKIFLYAFWLAHSLIIDERQGVGG